MEHVGIGGYLCCEESSNYPNETNLEPESGLYRLRLVPRSRNEGLK